ncbi:MAG: sensor histidine kinase [Sulfuricellaceae bacterium]|nr:sensor histidine kinase [Sulfuricellaceae bacterium]
MFSQKQTASTPSENNLRRLFVLRIIAIVGQIVAIAAVTYGIGMHLPLNLMGPVILLLTAFNFLTWLRLQKPIPVSDLELLGQLLVDIAALTALLYTSGGSTNPFVSLFLLPLTIAAAILPSRPTWFVAAVTVSCYTLLLFYYVPLTHNGSELQMAMSMEHGMEGHNHPGSGGDFGLHVLGMWFNFLLSASLIAIFVVRMAGSIRERDRLLASAREAALRNERIIALGTLAAGAAHELGTPLSTMAVITHELQQDYADNNELSEDLRLLRSQVDSCKSILSKLLDSAGQNRADELSLVQVDRYLDDLIEKWQIVRPGIALTIQRSGPQPVPQIAVEATLGQAILNLLNNAADASPHCVEIDETWDDKQLFISICDQGTGLGPEAMANAGKPFFTTKPPGQGIGIGLFLANATIERFGGTVRLTNRKDGGACNQISLPLLSTVSPEHS